MELEIGYRIQGVLRAEVEQEEEKSWKQLTGRLVHWIMHHPNKDALIADLRSKHPYTPFSEESRQMVHTTGNLERFELLRYLYVSYRCNTEIKHREIRHMDNPSLHNQEGREPRCSSW